MQTLLVISIFCLFVLLLAGVAIAPHIRSGHRRVKGSSRAHTSFAQHLVSAAESRGPVPSRVLPAQTVKQVMSNKTWNQPPEMITVRQVPEIQAAYDQEVSQSTSGTRKTLQSSYHGATERLDWAYFNKDRGDLTDPFQTPRLRASSRDKTPPPKRF